MTFVRHLQATSFIQHFIFCLFSPSSLYVLQAQEGTEAKEHSCLLQFLMGAVEEVGLQMGSPGDGRTPGWSAPLPVSTSRGRGRASIAGEGRAWRSNVSEEAQSPGHLACRAHSLLGCPVLFLVAPM